MGLGERGTSVRIWDMVMWLVFPEGVPAYKWCNRSAYGCRVPTEDESRWDEEGDDVVQHGDVAGFESRGEALGDIRVIWEERRLGQGADEEKRGEQNRV
jgi:hypothetical protein